MIMLTGQDDDDIAIAALKRGACDFLNKSHVFTKATNSYDI